MLPFFYTLRNLGREPLRTLQLIIGAFAVVFPMLLALAFDAGMQGLLSATGDPGNVILLSRDATESLQRSSIPGETQGEAAAQSGVSATCTEVHLISPVTTAGGTRSRLYLRGVTPAALQVHSSVQLTAGRFPRAGEVMVGCLCRRTLGVAESELAVGSRINIGGTVYRISGHFAAPHTRYESELWGDKNDALALTAREKPSCVVAAADATGVRRLENLVFRRSDLELAAVPEPKYYEDLGKFFRPLATISWLCALLISAGAVFGGFNTLYAAFSSRTQELAALRAIGFSRFGIYVSLTEESLLACLTGTLAACAPAVLLCEGMTIPLSAGTLTLHFDLPILLCGIGTGAALGILGAALPVQRCLSIPLATALRAD